MSAVRWHRAAAGLVAFATLAVAAASLSACGSEVNLPRLPQATIDVKITEYRFDYGRPVPAGRVVFRVVNAGGEPHRLSVLPLPEDLPPLRQQLRGSKRRAIAPFADIGELLPGTSNSLAVDLVAGRRYALIDISPAPGGRSNALLGLASEFRAGGGLPAASR